VRLATKAARLPGIGPLFVLTEAPMDPSAGGEEAGQGQAGGQPGPACQGGSHGSSWSATASPWRPGTRWAWRIPRAW
jgi:hypothetical protein